MSKSPLRKASADWAVRCFYPKTDALILQEWLRIRKIPIEQGDELPSIGFAVCKDCEAVAYGFIRICEGKVGIFDSVITDPNRSLYTRHLALEILFEKIISFAKLNDFKKLIGFSVDKGTIRRAYNHRFQPQSHAVLSLNLAP